MSIDKAIESASASLKMEGLHVSDELKSLLTKRLNNELSMNDYIRLAMELKGVKA